jgi:hypothetical protein
MLSKDAKAGAWGKGAIPIIQNPARHPAQDPEDDLKGLTNMKHLMISPLLTRGLLHLCS